MASASRPAPGIADAAVGAARALRRRARRATGRPAPLTLRGGTAVIVGVGCLIAASALARVELAVLGLALLALVAGAGASVLLAGGVAAVDRSLSTDVASVGGVSRVRLRLHLPARPLPGATAARGSGGGTARGRRAVASALDDVCRLPVRPCSASRTDGQGAGTGQPP